MIWKTCVGLKPGGGILVREGCGCGATPTPNPSPSPKELKLGLCRVMDGGTGGLE